MKNYKKIFLALIGLSLGLSSCTKQDGIYTQNGSDGIIELADLPSRTSSTAYSVVTKSLDASASIDLPITINYTGNSGAPEDISVVISFDDAAVATMSSSYTVLPSTLYTVPSYTVTIPKGSKTGTFHLTLNTASFDFTKTYALGVKIKSVTSGTISGNYGTGVFVIVAKNKYDGVYTVTATSSMVDNTSSTLTGYYPMTQELRTTGATSVVEYDGYLYANNFYHPIKSGTSTSAYGNFSPIFTMDADGNVTSVTNYYGQGTNSSVRAARLNPAGVNKFTVSGTTKTLEVSYIMTQSGADRTFFYEKWTYTKAR
ncbi:DUF1735 domain-containing protein [Pedobacter aquatilis]|uniref:DUF1735 domain-containing protein n=1 Tax=Pedobacter aquatilis TaxID=351343 RepID=UPI00292E5D15|nr:DUF1735 domain-containing protein [Pedobacter aquatilis]